MEVVEIAPRNDVPYMTAQLGARASRREQERHEREWYGTDAAVGDG